MARLSWLICMALLAGCSPSPYQVILGSYFPSWMLCLLTGILATAVVHRLLAAVKLDALLPLPLLTYLAITIAFTFGIWLLWLA